MNMKVTDTISFERFMGRITVRFMNFPHNVDQIAAVRLFAEGVSTRHGMSEESKPDRATDLDFMYDENLKNAHLTTRSNEYDLEVEHRYFPSIEEGMIVLNMEMLDGEGTNLTNLKLEACDVETGEPLRLGHGQRMIIIIDQYTVIKTGIVGWDEDIDSGGITIE